MKKNKDSKFEEALARLAKKSGRTPAEIIAASRMVSGRSMPSFFLCFPPLCAA